MYTNENEWSLRSLNCECYLKDSYVTDVRLLSMCTWDWIKRIVISVKPNTDIVVNACSYKANSSLLMQLQLSKPVCFICAPFCTELVDDPLHAGFLLKLTVAEAWHDSPFKTHYMMMMDRTAISMHRHIKQHPMMDISVCGPLYRRKRMTPSATIILTSMLRWLVLQG